MKIKWKTLIGAIALPIVVGGISALLSMGGMKHFESVSKPPLTPPGWLFPIAWTILYTLMGIASYLVLTANKGEEMTVKALSAYTVQLGFNFLWSIFFFGFELYAFSFVWLLALIGLIVLTMVRFYRIEPKSAYLLIPYLMWVAFAGYLNLGVAVLN